MVVNLKYRKITRILLHVSAAVFFYLLSGTDASAEILTLQNEMHGIYLDRYATYYEDKNASMTVNEISVLSDSLFQNTSKEKTQFGYTNSALWLKIDVMNNNSSNIDWLIESEYPLLDYITVFIKTKDGLNTIDGGDRLTFDKMPHSYHHFTADMSSPHGISTYYVRIQSLGSVSTILRAWDRNSFVEYFIYDSAFLWIFYGIMLALCIYNMFIFISSLDRSFLYLSLFIMSIMLFDLIHNGLARKVLWTDNPWWANMSHPFMIFMSIIVLLKFTQHFLDTKQNLPLAHRLLIALLIICGVSSVMIFFINYGYATILSVVISTIIFCFILFFAVIPMLFKNTRLALYYSFSCLFFALGVFFIVLRSFGFINDSFFVNYGYQIGIAAGNILFSIGLADKINTLRKDNRQAITSLRESEERYRLFFEKAHDAIMYVVNDYPVYANKNMIKMSGYSEKVFYTKSIYDFFVFQTPSDIYIWNIINNLKNGSINNSQFESVLINNAGEKIDIIMSLSALTTGKRRGIFIILTDITSVKNSSKIIQEQYNKIQSQVSKLESLNSELLEAQKIIVNANIEIEKEKEYLSATLSSIDDGVISYDTEGKIFLMNRVAEELTGVSSNEALGKNIREVLRLSNDSTGDFFFDTIGRISEQYNDYNIGVPFKLQSRTGEKHVVELNNSIIKLDAKPLGIVLALRDITIKSKIDTEILKMSKLETIGILAGGIAHDFNNLLTGISGNISIAKNITGCDHELSDIITDIEKAVKRSSALTKQLLTFARGGDPLKISTSLKDIINESVKFIIKDPGIKCTVNIMDDIRDVLVDPNQINQSINNLLINAQQAMPDGGEITITADNLDEIPQSVPLTHGSYVILKISDTGCGIPQDIINKIFDPFFTTKENGTGLGLTSTYSIIKKHMGHINVISSVNRGTTFEIYLKTANEPARRALQTNQSTFTPNGNTILIMDDEDYILDVFMKMLSFKGYHVECVKNGEEVVRKYREQYESGKPFDYVILDLTIYGGMGGKEAIELLRKINPEIKAIVSSGYSENPVMANYRDYGFTGVLTKPYSIDDILKVLS